MPNYKMSLCYEGTNYHGLQKQNNTKNTLQEKLETILSRIIGEPIEIIASGRTDAGVHANLQVANFHCLRNLDIEKTKNILMNQLPRDIGIYDLVEVPDEFHARYSCKAKTYRYYIWNSTEPCVFQRKYRTIIPEPLDMELMDIAIHHFIGEHDFSAFTTNKSKKHKNIRTITEVNIQYHGPEIIFEFTGDGFLYNMVRIMSGTLIEIGQGKRSIDSISIALQSKKRTDAGPTAPANALFLWDITY